MPSNFTLPYLLPFGGSFYIVGHYFFGFRRGRAARSWSPLRRRNKPQLRLDPQPHGAKHGYIH